jgi:predicted metal-dependent hydrolase
MKKKPIGGASVPASRHPLRLDRGEGRGEVSKSVSPAAVTAFKAQVSQWAERIRVRPRQLRLQRMRRKWASCSTRGTVSFSTEVLTQPAAFREYVIVHELLHLKVPNHGKLFKTLLRAYIPDYETIKPRPVTIEHQL